jgi:hypothetical protein
MGAHSNRISNLEAKQKEADADSKKPAQDINELKLSMSGLVLKFSALTGHISRSGPNHSADADATSG